MNANTKEINDITSGMKGFADAANISQNLNSLLGLRKSKAFMV